MRLFLYEFITGGGLLPAAGDSADSTDDLPASLLAEGRAMISALAADALAIPGVELCLLWDARLDLPEVPAECLQPVANSAAAKQAFDAAVQWAEGTILIAPETGSQLTALALIVELECGGLLSASPELSHLCSDKHRTAEHLRASGVPAPCGLLVGPREELPHDFPLPAVLKPNDGCGSQDIRLLTSWPAAGNPLANSALLEQFCPGEAVSVAVLCGIDDSTNAAKQILQPLPACRQDLADDGTFAYRGGSLTLPAELSMRAQSLALRAVASLPQPLGYIGVDLVLGPASDGSQDFVIEINPRLTTSYVGLRQATDDNLLAAWLQIARGEPASLKFNAAPIQFWADGQVTK